MNVGWTQRWRADLGEGLGNLNRPRLPEDDRRTFKFPDASE